VRDGLFVVLLAAQYPVLFAIERGNNDVIVVVAWTAALALWLRERYTAAGFACGVATALKLYPAVACGVVGGALVLRAARDPTARRRMARFATGVGGAITLAAVLLRHDTLVYLSAPLAYFASLRDQPSAFAHTLHVAFPAYDGWPLKVPLFAVWLLAATRVLRRDPALALSGALAISTYFSGISYDYNLVTTMPLLVVLYSRAFPNPEPPPRQVAAAYALLVMGLMAIVGHRALFASGPSAMRAHVVLQWAWLVSTALAVSVIARRDTAPLAATGRRA
jgi:hypothetical protein